MKHLSPIPAIILFLFTFLYQPSLFSQSNNIETSGDILLIALPVAALGTTLIIGDKKGTWQFTKGFVVNQAITFGLKNIIDRERPNMENNNSFPSGHTSTTFQSAAFIQKRYGWKYGVPAYVLAGFTGFTRLNSDQHYFTDILAGALIGIGSSYIFTTPYQQEHLELTFSGRKGNYMAGFNYKF